MNILKINCLIIAVTASLLIVSCGKTQKGPVSLSGNIENIHADSVYLINSDIRKAIAVNDNSFSDTLSLQTPVYLKFYADRQYTWIYLTPNTELSLKTDMNLFDDQLVYEGALAEENNFLAKKIVKQVEMAGNSSKFFSQDAASFKEMTENYKNELLSELNESEASSEFKDLEKKNIEFEFLLMLSQYPQANAFYTQSDTQLPNDFANEIEKVDTDNEEDFCLSLHIVIL